MNFIMGIESFIGAIYKAITASMFYTKAKKEHFNLDYNA